MKIAVNLLYLIPGRSGGTETYVRGLLRELVPLDAANDYVVYGSEDTITMMREVLPDITVRSVGRFRNKFTRIAWEQFVFPFVLMHDGMDAVFSPGYVSPVLFPGYQIVTIHDMLYRRYPQAIQTAKRMYWNIFIPLSVRWADAVITVSEFSKKEIGLFFPRAEGKTKVTLEAVDHKDYYPDGTMKLPPSFPALPDSFILCVATMNPHKNIAMLMSAVSELREKHGMTVHVVLTGNKEWDSSMIASRISEQNLAGQVHLLGYVSKDVLRYLYSNATLFVLPSRYEGFGLPILEAMACGCPVLCARAGSMPEVGGTAARYFDVSSVPDLAAAVMQIYGTPRLREELREAGKANVARFHWSSTARQTIEVMNGIRH